MTHARRRCSLLFVPGDRPEMIRKTPRTAADAVIMDLEDAVKDDRKAAARESVLSALKEVDFGRRERIVRVNARESGHGEADLAALASAAVRPDSVMIAKCQVPDDVRWVAASLPDTSLIPLVESARGMMEVSAIAAAHENVDALMLGGGDLAADLGVDLSPHALQYARGRFVLAAAARGLARIDMPYMRKDDPEGLRAEALHVCSIGFTGKTCIHPAQVSVVNEVFTPPAARVDWARRVLEAYQSAQGGAVALDGEVIDAMTLRLAQGVLARAGGKTHSNAD